MVYPHMYRTEKSETKTTNSMYGEYYAKLQSRKIGIQPDLLKLFRFIDSNREAFVDDLAEAVAIPSISEDVSHKPDVIRMIKITERWLKKINASYECFNIGYRDIDGVKVKLLPVILASLGNNPKNKTLCIYGHLDVNKPNMEEWKTDPWKLTEINKRFYGAGAARGKGSLLCWFHAILTFERSKVPIPVNLKFIIESMNTCHSIGLEDFLLTKRQDFLWDIDYVVVCDTQWIGEKHPCLTYGVVGYSHFDIIYEQKKDSPTNIRDDAKLLAEKIVEHDGKNIPGFNSCVVQITPDEEKLYEALVGVDIEKYRQNLPEELKELNLCSLLMRFWRLPSVDIGEIEECNCDKQEMDKIKQHLTFKLVPLMVPERSESNLKDFIRHFRHKTKTENEIDIKMIHCTRPWFQDIRSINYVAATRASIQIYKEQPNFIRVDSDLVVINILDRIIDKQILLLPLVNANSNLGSSNENFLQRNYYEATKLLCSYVLQLHLLSKS